MQNNRILKIKIKGKFITLQWEHYQQSTKNWDGHALTSADPPRPELIEYMKKMGKHIVGICEMQKSDINKVEARSISLSYGEDGSGVVISGIKELEHNTSPLCINTPYKPEFGPEGMEECGMSAELQEAADRADSGTEGQDASISAKEERTASAPGRGDTGNVEQLELPDMRA